MKGKNEGNAEKAVKAAASVKGNVLLKFETAKKIKNELSDI